ncbi:hypothetical protein [Pontibacter russatus]|uniref:hypothetical protein n=1 Tax=Pontibacter russatus TaxID=2694929 RepID=UPI001379EAFD|nr:hypothetical protein [Pontibacter russatus]
MKANVPSDEFIGSAAAGTHHHASLQQFLDAKGVDTTRYEPVGAGFSGGGDAFSGFIICKDNQRSTEERDHLIKLYFEEKMAQEEFFSLFKRFEVVVISKHGVYDIAETNGELVIEKEEDET